MAKSGIYAFGVIYQTKVVYVYQDKIGHVEKGKISIWIRLSIFRVAGEMEDKHLKKEISLFMATMLVCGNMIGSGVFMLPSTLAQVSGPGATIIAWIITTIGSILIAISFANLGTKYPSTGGAYQYTKGSFG